MKAASKLVDVSGFHVAPGLIDSRVHIATDQVPRAGTFAMHNKNHFPVRRRLEPRTYAEDRAPQAKAGKVVSSGINTVTSSRNHLEPPGRILTIQDGEARPLYEIDPVGAPAPSSTLLVERFDQESMRWQTHLATELHLKLHLKPSIFMAREEDRAVNRLTLSAGDVGFSSRWMSTSVHSHGPVSQLCVRVADSTLMEVTNDLGWNDQLEFTAERVIRNDQLTGLLYALEAERRNGYPSGPLFIDGIELAVATFLIKSYGIFSRRPYRDHADERKSGSLSLALPPHLLRRVLDRMRDLTAELNLEVLAAETGYSRRHFLRMFQKATGSTPHQYLLQSRLQRAQDLISRGSGSLIDIAAACGFSSHAHMSKVFRKLLDVSPSEYRRSL